MARPAPELIFNFASGQNQFFVELAEALVAALRAQGTPARIVFDDFPEPRAGRVYVLLPPHEHAVLSRFRPPRAVLRRCIGISAEQPSSHFFASNLELGRDLGAVFDINPRAIRAYRRAGVAARHLKLGYSPLWDRFDAGVTRDIDVLFLGRLTDRRGRALARCADSFERFRVHLQLSDGGRPNLAGAPDFVAGEEKRALLARTKVLLTIHGEDEPYFEWLRISEAICAGAMVVSEHSSDIAPLRSGEHLITGGVDRLGLLCAWAVESDREREKLRTAAYELLRRERPIATAAAELARAAHDIDATASPAVSFAGARFDFLIGARAGRPDFQFQPPLSPYEPAERQMLRALKAQSIATLGLRRRLDRLASPSNGGPPSGRSVVAAETPGWTAAKPELSVIVPLHNHADEVTDAMQSVLGSVRDGWELVVVDDGSDDGGARVVADWLERNPKIAARLVRHPVNRGLPHARNTGIDHARADLLLMLDADNELRSTAIGRLVKALQADPAASFAYGISERFDAGGPLGLLSEFPWDPERLRGGNYIDALALIRRVTFQAVGRYSLDPRLHGWEDYDLWARIAEAGGHGAFVPEIIARYRVGHSSMVSVTNISTTDAFAAVADHAPTLMRGLRIPN